MAVMAELVAINSINIFKCPTEYTYTHTHTHTHIYIYIYIYIYVIYFIITTFKLDRTDRSLERLKTREERAVSFKELTDR